MVGSEVEHLRQQIADEYLAAKLGLSGLRSGTSRHEFITASMERMGHHQEKLQKLVGNEVIATRMLAETLAKLPDPPTRASIEAALRRELGPTEETESLLEHIYESWKTADSLIQRFGEQAARMILTAPEHRKDPHENGN